METIIIDTPNKGSELHDVETGKAAADATRLAPGLDHRPAPETTKGGETKETTGRTDVPFGTVFTAAVSKLESLGGKVASDVGHTIDKTVDIVRHKVAPILISAVVVGLSGTSGTNEMTTQKYSSRLEEGIAVLGKFEDATQKLGEKKIEEAQDVRKGETGSK